MFFGNQYKMREVPMPAINAGIGQEKWSTSGTFLNGGGYVRASTTGHKVYQFSWPPMSAEDARRFLDFSDGIYGPGPFYFADPFAMSTNMMNTLWSAPWLMQSQPKGEGSGTMLEGVKGNRVTTHTNTKNLPPFGMQYAVSSAAARRSFPIPVPPGHTLHLGVHGAGTPMQYQWNGGAPTSAAMISTASATLTNVTLGGGVAGGLVTLSLAASPATGFTAIYGIIAQVLPTGSPAPTGSWISGRGSSAVEFDGPPQVTGYSAPQGIDRQGVTATLREVGTWL